MALAQLPACNAALNALAGGLLVFGRILIRRGRLAAHRRVMIAATATSSLFLALYLLHKASRGFQHTSFGGEGIAQLLYLSLLASHVVLAIAVPPLAFTLIALGLRDRRALHRRIARIAWPIWIYVSASGVLIYFALYHLNPTAAAADPPSREGVSAHELRIGADVFPVAPEPPRSHPRADVMGSGAAIDDRAGDELPNRSPRTWRRERRIAVGAARPRVAPRDVR